MEDIKKLLGDRIRTLRKERGLSQEELGYKSELHYTRIGAIERGEKNCSIDTLIKVAMGLNIKIIDLFEFPTTPAEVKNLKKSLIEDINASSSVDTVKILSNILKGFRAIEFRTINRNPKGKM